MWSEYLVNNVMFERLFPLGLSIYNSEITYWAPDGNNLKVSICIKEIPESYPEKWDKEKFNAISFTLSFVDVIYFECCVSNFFEIKKFIIEADESRALLDANDDGITFYCRSKFIRLEGATPYEDERWG